MDTMQEQAEIIDGSTMECQSCGRVVHIDHIHLVEGGEVCDDCVEDCGGPVDGLR